MEKWTYDAFISYRHSELDKFVAENLHRQLESFRLPKKVVENAEHKGADGHKAEVRTRITRVFRDKDELPLTNNLEDPIRKALEGSECLIVICSPRLKESIWCKKEIETFISMHGREKVFAVLVEGEPEDSFPEELLSWEETVTRPDGSTEVVKHLLEPWAADVRGADRRAVLKAMKTEILRLLAPMFGLQYDDLRQRHRERRMRRILSASLAVAGVCLAFGAVSTSMALRISSQKAEIASQNEELFKQQEQIQTQNEQLMQNQALSLAENSLDRLSKGDRIGAIQLATQALTEYDGMEMPYTARAQYALTESLYVYDSRIGIKPLYQFETKGIINFTKVSPDGKLFLTCDASEGLILWDVGTGKQIKNLPDNHMNSERSCTFVGSERVAYFGEKGEVEIYDISTGDTTCFERGFYSALFADEEGKYLVLSSLFDIMVYDANSMELLDSVTLPEGAFVYTFPTISMRYFEALPIYYEVEKQKYLCFWDLQEGVSRTVLEMGEGFSPVVGFRGDIAYVLFDVQKEDWRLDAYLLACNWRSGEILWKKTFENTGGDMFYLPCVEEAESLLLATGAETRLVHLADGEEVACFALGSSVVGGGVMMTSDYFVTFTRSGEYHTTGGVQKLDYVQADRFLSHSQNVKEFKVTAEGFLVLPYQDNRVTLYNYFTNEDAVEIEEEVPVLEDLFLEYSDAEKFAKEKGLEKAALARFVLDVPEQGMTVLWYSDDVLEIYNTADMTLLAAFFGIQDSVRYYYGEDRDGNLYIGGAAYTYVINKNFEILGRIERLRYLNTEENYLVQATTSGVLRQIPIYSLEELLVKAQECVVEFSK